MDEHDRKLMEDDKIYDLVDVIDEEGKEAILPVGIPDDEIREVVSKVAERIARELFPGIAERVIREEIDKLKKYQGE